LQCPLAMTEFHPLVQSWFTEAFGKPTPPQILGWPSIAAGNNTLIVAPTGSGKTLAAFLWCINRLVEEKLSGVDTEPGVRVLYISPLKALNNDIHWNLDIPLHGIQDEAVRRGIQLPKIRTGIRTGDTTQPQRRSMLTHPPDILITTPESLYLMLTAKLSRAIFSRVAYVIVDEIHSISSSKRGVHLSLTLERLEALVAVSPVRIGLSATQKPLETTARFLGGQRWSGRALVPRPVTIIDTGGRKNIDLRVQSAVPDFSDIDGDTVWDAVYPQLANAIARHTSTLIFVNNRRLAERVATKLNDIINDTFLPTHNYAQLVDVGSSASRHSPQTITVQAYHSSTSRTSREKMEQDLKAGRLRALIATSSLELGIDVGAIDLVIQLQSPGNIARGIQRVGRSGHLIDATSKGRIIATHRQDLLESAVIAKSMLDTDIESTQIPRNCLDVLAQQIVACVSVEEWNTDELYALVRQAFPYESLSEELYMQVLEMLAGRYTQAALREFQPRISWNKIRQTLSALPGTSRLAILSGGTIPDRGYYPVYLEDRKTKIGELDEEFIHESRNGDTFILGSHVWKMLEVEPQRIIAVPAPGHPARMPFWRGERPGRSYELSVRIGAFLEELSSQKEETAADWLLEHYPLDRTAALALADYVFTQRRITGSVPTHKHIVVETFRDEIGDPRIVIHSCFGRSINGLIGMLLSGPLSARVGTDVQMLYNDDGILFRCPDVERFPLDLFASLLSMDVAAAAVDEVMRSPLFGSLFRQNAARALLLPRSMPGKRTPLWLQRLRASDLLQVARRFTDFPIVTETMREALNDTLDYQHFLKVVEQIRAGDISVTTVQTEQPSPFASSLLFEFVATYLYDTDKPKGTAPAQAPLSDQILQEAAGVEIVRKVFERDAYDRIEQHLQFKAPTRQARTKEELFEIFIRLGELTQEEVRERCSANSEMILSELLQEGTITQVRIGGKDFYVAAEDVSLYHSLIQQATETPIDPEQSLRYLILRTLRTHAAIPAEKIAGRYAKDLDTIRKILRDLEKHEPIRSGLLFGENSPEVFYYTVNLERIHRASLGIRRREFTPATIGHFSEFLQRWQHRSFESRLRDEEDVKTLVEQFQGFNAPAEIWESEIFRPRLRYYAPAQLRRLIGNGEAACVGRGSGKSTWIMRGGGSVLPSASVDACSSSARRVYDVLQSSGALFLSDLREEVDLPLPKLNSALTELFWAGLITNDSFDELLNLKKNAGKTSGKTDVPPSAQNRRIAMAAVRKALRNSPGWNGRWTLTRSRALMGKNLTTEELASRQAEILLRRYGVVSHEMALREDFLLPWTLIAQELQRLEMRGEIRRGYFVQGLSGMQFALPDAAEQIKELSAPGRVQEYTVPIVLNTCDPANPFGGLIEIPGFASDMRLTRLSGNHLVCSSGSPALYVENSGTRIWFAESIAQVEAQSVLQEYLLFLKSSHTEVSNVRIEYCGSQRPMESPRADVFKALGFYRDARQAIRKEL
jgi:ATP-dependent Lhr-like helicase